MKNIKTPDKMIEVVNVFHELVAMGLNKPLKTGSVCC